MPEQSTVSPQTYLLRHVLEKSDGQNAFFKVSPLKASLFLPLPIRIDYQSFLNFHAALRVATHAPDLSEESREFLLDNIELALSGIDLPQENNIPPALTRAAKKLYALQQNNFISAQWGHRLIQAARKDILRPSCVTWADLMLYCRFAAEPLSRALLERCHIKDAPQIESASDALAAALLVLNKLRHAKVDWCAHGRCYLPTQWINEEGGSPEQLIEDHLSPALKKVTYRMLERTEILLQQTNHLSNSLEKYPYLRSELARLLKHAHTQIFQIRTKDLLKTPLKTSRWQTMMAYCEGWFAK